MRWQALPLFRVAARVSSPPLITAVSLAALLIASLLFWGELKAYLAKVRSPPYYPHHLPPSQSCYYPSPTPPSFACILKPCRFHCTPHPKHPGCCLLQEVVEFMEVDPIRGETLRINFDITFPSMPCAGEWRGHAWADAFSRGREPS